MPATVPLAATLIAPPTWRTVDFISDLHLQASEPATFALWQHYLQTTAADAVFILGDLFEVWIGDDAVGADPTGFEQQCADVLAQTARSLPVYFMHGNRDFLVGGRMMQRCATTLLTDPTVLQMHGQRYLLSHGDALCIDDVDYIAFRKQVRSAAWQQTFLAQSLAQRQAIAADIRQQSEAKKHSTTVYADVDADMARQWLKAAQAHTLIHGHTHRPASHALGAGLSRSVLSDWHADGPEPRADVLRLSADGLTRIALV